MANKNASWGKKYYALFEKIVEHQLDTANIYYRISY